MSINSRLAAIERRQPVDGRFVIVSPAADSGDNAGSIVRGATERNCSLKVPFEHAANPMDGLTDDQRDFIQPTDTVIVVKHGKIAL